MQTVIGIDNGTQSTKVIFYDFKNKTIIAEASASHDIISKKNGSREQKAEWWITALMQCFAAIPEKIKKTAQAVGVSGQQHGFVPLDKEGNVLYNVKLWCDMATTQECSEIETRFGSVEDLFSEGGNRILPGYTASKILWFKKNFPEYYNKMQHILLPHDYLNFYLTGKYTMELGDASGTGFLNIRDRKWSNKIINAIDPEKDLISCLPNLLKAHEFAGLVTPKAATEFGLPSGIPVSSGGGDNMMGAIGTGATAPGVMTMSLGTSGTIYGYSNKPIIDESENLAAFCSSTGGWLPLLCTMNCTVGTELIRSLFDMGIKRFDSEAGDAPAGSDGIITLPFFTGERTPNLPRGKGCIVGMTDTNMKRSNIFRSTMEAAIFGIRLGLDTFKEKGFIPKEVRIIGGGANSRLWCQIAADILNLPTVVPVYKEAAALGAALQALWALQNSYGAETDINDITIKHVQLDDSGRYIPEKKAVKIYNDHYLQYTNYIEKLRPLFV